MHDGAPVYVIADIRNFLDDTYSQRWIGPGGPLTWHARSPDLNPLDFSFCVRMKSLLYQSPVDSIEGLAARIIVAADKISATPGIFERVRQSIIRRCKLCNTTLGRHFEQLLWVCFDANKYAGYNWYSLINSILQRKLVNGIQWNVVYILYTRKYQKNMLKKWFQNVIQRSSYLEKH